MADAPATYQEFHLANLPGRRARDRIQMACRDARWWEVRIVSDGEIIGAFVSPDDLVILREAKARLAGKDAETEATPQD